jgi:predicted HTH transcriptional regulator
MGAIPTSDMPAYVHLHKRVCGALDCCQETAAVEFKEPAPWPALRQRLIPTIMAMGNLRDGGMVIIGVSERGGRWEPVGIGEGDWATYDPDDIADAVNKYSSPPVEFELVRVSYSEKDFLVIKVSEFQETPFICKRDGPGLTQGTVYIRPSGKPETRRVGNSEEMHALLELAAEKRAARMLATTRRLTGLGASPSDDELFGRELSGL